MNNRWLYKSPRVRSETQCNKQCIYALSIIDHLSISCTVSHMCDRFTMQTGSLTRQACEQLMSRTMLESCGAAIHRVHYHSNELIKPSILLNFLFKFIYYNYARFFIFLGRTKNLTRKLFMIHFRYNSF